MKHIPEVSHNPSKNHPSNETNYSSKISNFLRALGFFFSFSWGNYSSNHSFFKGPFAHPGAAAKEACPWCLDSVPTGNGWKTPGGPGGIIVVDHKKIAISFGRKNGQGWIFEIFGCHFHVGKISKKLQIDC